MTLGASTEKGTGASLEKGSASRLVVVQPHQIQALGEILETIDNLTMRVSERTGEDRSWDMGGAGAASTTGTAGAGVSARDLAIANLPNPEVMQENLERFIRSEIGKLNRQTRKASRMGKPGTAHCLNELYARIRRLNALLKELLEASIDVIKRVFIRVFIDKQPIL